MRIFNFYSQNEWNNIRYQDLRRSIYILDLSFGHHGKLDKTSFYKNYECYNIKVVVGLLLGFKHLMTLVTL